MRTNHSTRFFRKLCTACSYHDAYCVAEICAYFGVSYEQAVLWANADPYCADLLYECHAMCASNREIAGLKRRISS